MSRYRSTVTFLILTLVTIVLVGCGGSDYRKQETYYLLATNVNLPYWQVAKAGLMKSAAELGVAAEVVGPETYDPQAQKEAFQKIMASKTPPAGIMISVADPDVLRDAIDGAIAKGINVITIDSDAPKSKRLFFVGTDNYDAGVEAAEVTAEQLQNAGNVVVFTIHGQVNLADRLRGYKDVFATYPAIRIIDTVDIKGNAAAAFDWTKQSLEKERSKVDAFVCLEAIACPDVAEVLNRNHIRDKVVVAMDTPDRTLQWIQRGLIQATMGQKPYTMAYVGIRMLADLKKYPPTEMTAEGSLATVPEFVNTGATLIDKDNVARFLKEQQSTNPAEAAPAGGQ